MSHEPSEEGQSAARAGEECGGEEVAVAVLGVLVFFSEVRELEREQGRSLLCTIMAVLLRLLREREDATVLQMERSGGPRRQSIMHWERAEQSPGFDALDLYCPLLAVSLPDFVGAAVKVQERMM